MSVTWRGFLSILIPGAIVLLVLEGLLHPNPRERNYEIFTEMVYSEAGESFSPSSVLPGAQTQQPIVAGVVVRGQRPFRYGPGPEEAKRAGDELANTMEATPEALARGAAVYGVYCVLCHGGDGNGQGPIVARGMLPPPSFHAARALEMGDGEMFHVITMGQGNMGSHAAQVGADDRWKVVLHIRALQQANLQALEEARRQAAEGAEQQEPGQEPGQEAGEEPGQEAEPEENR
jgi:mono/diheme cytochrome c family protein